MISPIKGVFLGLVLLLQPICCCYGDWFMESLEEEPTGNHACCSSNPDSTQHQERSGEHSENCPHQGMQNFEWSADVIRSHAPTGDLLSALPIEPSGFLAAYPRDIDSHKGQIGNLGKLSPPSLFRVFCVYLL